MATILTRASRPAITLCMCLVGVGARPAAAEDGHVAVAPTIALATDVDQAMIKPVGYQQCVPCKRGSGRCDCGECRFARRWDGAFEIGLNGAEGNSRNINLVLGFDAKREEGRRTTTLDIDYLYSRDEVETTKNRLYSLTRYEYDVPDSNWGWFFDNWFEYDELEDFRSRIGFHAGRVATLLKTNDCELKGLIGVGTSKEFEGNDTDWKPELYLGTAWERSINDRQDIYVRSIFLPDIGDFGSFRLRVKAGWDLALNEKETWKLSLSMFDRYDSTPSGSDRKNDIDYWASFAWSF